jgi:hypothetical protein
VSRPAERQVSFADWELMRQGLRLEPLLQAISDFRDDQKDMIEQVRCDLIRGLKSAATGRSGMTPQQILRSLVPMRIKNWDYCELRERIADRCRLRQFTDFYCAGAVWCLSMAAATAASVDTSGVTACALSGWSSDADPVGPNIRARAKGGCGDHRPRASAPGAGGRQLRCGVQHQRQPRRLVPDQQQTSGSDGRLGGGRFHPTLVHTFPAFEDATAASMKRMPAKPSRTVG